MNSSPNGQPGPAVTVTEINALFPPGQIVITIGAADAFMKGAGSPESFLLRHLSGDWGELEPEDVAENNLSVREGYRILSAYTTKGGTKIWIITEADRSSTTILLPSEY